MTRMALIAALAASLMAIAAVAHADDDIDVDRVEIIEVVETADGSVWKGVILEFVPGASIKIALSGGSVHVIPIGDIVRITREKNRRWVAASQQPPPSEAPARRERPVPSTGASAVRHGPTRSRLAPPFARSGLRVGVGLLATSPTEAWAEQSNTTLSFAPTILVGFERLYGHVGLSGGARLTWIYFLDDVASKDAFWTLETHGYVRTALHVGKLAAYAGLALGVDTNYSYFTNVRNSYLRVGPGVEIEAGADVAASSRVSFGLAAVVHPGTAAAAAPDAVPSDAVPDVSHFGLRLGTTWRF